MPQSGDKNPNLQRISQINPFPDLLNTNAVPTEEQVVVIKRTVLEAKLKLAQLVQLKDSEPTRKGKERLELEHQSLQNATDLNLTLLSSSRFVPSELWSEIFLNTVDLRSKAKPTLTPLLLAHICYRWRDIAFQTPVLWKSLEILLDRMGSKSYRKFVLGWLGRARDCQLNLYIRQSTLFPVQKPHKITDLLPFVPRIRRLHCVLSARFYELLLPMERHLLALEEIELNFMGMVLDNQSLPVFAKASKLVDVALGSDKNFFILPWEQLTHYSCETGGINYYREVLLKALNLQHLSANCTHSSPNTAPLIVWLTSLRLSCRSYSPFVLIDTLTLPNLLELAVFDRYSDTWNTSLRDFLIRSSPPLQTLTLAHTGVNAVQLTDCLRLTTKLQTLIIGETNPNIQSMNQAMIHSLTVQISDLSSLVPQLSVLKLRGPPQCDPDLFLKMAQSRTPSSELRKERGVSPLKRIHIMFPSHHKARKWNLVKGLRSQGVECRIGVYQGDFEAFVGE